MSVTAKFNTIQPIDGTKGNLALRYYQGKYGLAFRQNEKLYQTKSVERAFIESFKNIDIRTNTDATQWLYKQETKRLLAYRLRRAGCDTDDPRFQEWLNMDHNNVKNREAKRQIDRAFIEYLHEPSILGSYVIGQFNDQPVGKRQYNGWYVEEVLMLDYAGWLSKAFHSEIYECFAMSAERDRLYADINHKQTTIDVLRAQNAKIISQNDELLSVNRKMCTQLETIKVTLSTLVENVSELKNHVTSNKLCRYIIVLYTDEERSDDKFIVIKPFCGLRENCPKIEQSTILFEREVSCSIDSFKEALSALEQRYIVKIHYRSIMIRRSNLEDFIDEFRVELRRRSTTVTDVCKKLDTITEHISTIDTKVTSIDERLKNYETFMTNYGTDQSFVKRVLDGEVTCKNKGKVYQLQLSLKNQQPFINVDGYRLYMPVEIFHKRYL